MLLRWKCVTLSDIQIFCNTKLKYGKLAKNLCGNRKWMNVRNFSWEAIQILLGKMEREYLDSPALRLHLPLMIVHTFVFLCYTWFQYSLVPFVFSSDYLYPSACLDSLLLSMYELFYQVPGRTECHSQSRHGPRQQIEVSYQFLTKLLLKESSYVSTPFHCSGVFLQFSSISTLSSQCFLSGKIFNEFQKKKMMMFKVSL